MAKDSGFFSGSERRDKRIAGNLGASTPVRIDNVTTRTGETFKRVLPNFGAGRVGEIRLKKAEAERKKPFFSQEVGQIASATTDLSGMLASSDFDKTGYDKFLNKGFGVDSESRIYKSFPNSIKFDLKQQFKEDKQDGQLINQLPKNYGEQEQQVIQDNKFNKYIDKEFGSEENLGPGDKYFLRESFDEGNPYQRFNFDQSFKTPKTDTKVAMLGGDNLGGYGALGLAGSIFGLGLKGIQSAIEGGKNLKENIEKRINPESIQDKVGGFFNRMTGISPVAAGTLDANQQVAQVSERPKLSYVNPDAKTMTLSEMGEAFKRPNLFGYKDKFGRFDDPGSPLARDRAETIQRVAQNFSSPIVGDARTIGQIRADQEARMRENARLRNESFQRGERVQQKSADVTYGTNMLSNPAFGFRDKMTDAAKAQYDRSAKDATEMARPDPSIGNVLTSVGNVIKKALPKTPFTRQASLESIGERQLRLANKEINRPTYQKEAYARKFLGITNDQLKARNMQQIRANAYARNQAFQNDRVQRALEKSALRRGENIGTGRDGGFGLGTSGQGMPSNPKGFSGYSRTKSSTGTGTGTSTSKGGISKSTSRGQGGGPSSRSKGGTGTGKSTQGRGGRRGGSTGGSGASSKGGTGKGQSRSGGTTGRKASKASKGRTGRGRSQCDIRTKIDITSLTNQNLIKDELATVAYFVQGLRAE